LSIGEFWTTDQGTDSVLGTILLSRGWRPIDDDRAWEWPHRGRGTERRLFAPGACVLVDETSGAYVVEGPAEHDRPTTALRYRTRRELLDRLDRIEAWTFPQTAAELDADHADAVVDGPFRS
jgi:hypothetical protein